MCAVKYEDEAIITLLVEAVRRNSEERFRPWLRWRLHDSTDAYHAAGRAWTCRRLWA